MTPFKTWTMTEAYVNLRGKLLEGPTYDPRSNRLLWVDIALDRVHCLDLLEGPKSLRTWTVDGDTVGTLYSTHESINVLVVGAKYGLATFDTRTGTITYFYDFFRDTQDVASQITRRRFRANDGAIDVQGRILQGILIDDKIEPPTNEGILISIDLNSTSQVSKDPQSNDPQPFTTIASNIVCPNGLAWSTSNEIMYFAESRSGNIYAYDYDVNTGSATNQRVFFHVPGADGEKNLNVPDGLIVDEEDHIWLAVWGGGVVLRITPDAEVVGTVKVPTRFVTCPLLVGTMLYATTAAEREGEEDVEAYEESKRGGGMLYRVDVGVKGVQKNLVHLPSSFVMSGSKG